MKLNELAGQIGATLEGDGDAEITGVRTLREAVAGQVSFLTNVRYLKQLGETKASAVIVDETVRRPASGVNLLRAKNPYFAYRQAVVALHGFRKHPFAGIHPDAHVDPSAVIGENTVIYPGVYVGPGATVGRDGVLYPGVCVYDECVLGDRVIVHANTVLGLDGFGFATHQGVHHKIPHPGRVVIGNDVEIGASTTIERAPLGETRIGDGTKLGSNVMIGHGTTVGKGCMLVAQVGIAGSVTVGNYVVMAGQVGVAGHITIADQVRLGGQSGVVQDIDEPGDYVGSPPLPIREGLKLGGTMGTLVSRLRELEKRVAALTAARES